MHLVCRVCGVQSGSIQRYGLHQKLHSNIPNYRFCCGFRPCRRRFSTSAAFRAHAYREHIGKKGKPLNIELENEPATTDYQCQIPVCKASFSSMKKLISHLQYHIRVEAITVTCPYQNCEKQFKKRSSFTSHISRNHSENDEPRIQSIPIMREVVEPGLNIRHDCPEDIQSHSINAPEFATDALTGDHFDEDTDENCAEGDLSGQYMKDIAFFFMKLHGKLLLPDTFIQEILMEMDGIHEVDHELLKQKLSAKMMSLRVSDDVASEIIKEIDAPDPWTTNVREGHLRSTFSRQKYFANHFSYVKPVTVHLGHNADRQARSFQYIPILDTLKVFVQSNSEFVSYPNRCENVGLTTFRDVHDGSVFKTNELFQSKALQIILYQDAFEVVNPLGHGRGKHKLVGIYFTLANLAPHNRSSVDHIQVVMLINEKDLKEFGEEKVYQILIDDLKQLETMGIDVGKEEPLKGSLIAISGDNLGSHGLGGYVESFSSSFFCRYCVGSRSEIFASNMPTKGDARTPTNYAEALAEKQRQGVASFQGLKKDSMFNQLKYYHVAQPGLPPCLAHDLFEGVVAVDLPLILSYIIREEKWLTYSQLNERISKFVYLGGDALDKPCPVSQTSSRCSGNAVRIWVFLRLLPLYVRPFIQDKRNPVWLMLLKLKEVVEIVCSPTVSEADVAYLQVCIEEYLYDRKITFPHSNLKPKHHFLFHYPELILAFGPLARMWTLRFESKHSYFKKCARKLQNFINLPKTLAERHQILQTYYNTGSLFTKSLGDLDAAVPFDPTIYNDDVQTAVDSGANLSENTLISTKVRYMNTDYKKGMFLIIGIHERGLTFGEILGFLISDETDLYFLVKVYQSEHLAEMGLYEIPQEEHPPIQCIASGSILDHYPLPAYKQGMSSYISLKHHVGRGH